MGLQGLQGLQGTPQDSRGLRRTPGDSAGLQGTPQDSRGLRRTPGDSAGLQGTPQDSAGLQGTPQDSTGLRRTPRDSAGLRDSVESLESAISPLVSLLSQYSRSRDDSSNILCMISSDDSDDETDSSLIPEDSPFCIYPIEIRPYKLKKPMWSRQKAVQMTFSRALDKSRTLNVWSCGLGSSVHDSLPSHDLQIYERMVDYAIHDLVAPAALYLHFNGPSTSRSSVSTSCCSILPVHKRAALSHQQSISTSSISSITIDSSSTLSSIFLLSDSHGRYLPSPIIIPQYCLINLATSGLQWYQAQNELRCVRSFIQSASIVRLIALASM